MSTPSIAKSRKLKTAASKKRSVKSSATPAAEPNRQARRLSRDYGSVSFDDAPDDAGIGITVAVLHGDEIKFDPSWGCRST
jgi:hypothetical protein